MNAANTDDADDEEDDDDAVKKKFAPKLVMFRRHCKCCMTACPSVLAAKIFNKSSTHSQFQLTDFTTKMTQSDFRTFF